MNAKDENKYIALQGTAAQGYKGIIRLLLDSGANIDTEDLDSATAVIFADRRGQSGVLGILESYSRRNTYYP